MRRTILRPGGVACHDRPLGCSLLPSDASPPVMRPDDVSVPQPSHHPCLCQKCLSFVSSCHSSPGGRRHSTRADRLESSGGRTGPLPPATGRHHRTHVEQVYRDRSGGGAGTIGVRRSHGR
jgi:hypothetical protein